VQNKALIDLSRNEYPEPPLALLEVALPRAIAIANLYPVQALVELRQALAKHHDVDEAQILVANGATDLIWLLARWAREARAAGSEAEALAPAVSFVAYTQACGSAGVRLRYGPMRADYGIDLDALLQSVSESTRVVFLANPNNPTGGIIGNDEFSDFMARIPTSVMVVIDEAYRIFSDVAARIHSAELQKRHANLLILHTFSKSFGIAGLRLGYAIGTASLLAQIERHSGPFSVNMVALVAGLLLLGHPDFAENAARKNNERRSFVTDALTQLGLRVLPSQGNFMSILVPGQAKELADTLLSYGIRGRTLDDYGLPDGFRITVGNELQNAALISALQKIKQSNALNSIFANSQ